MEKINNHVFITNEAYQNQVSDAGSTTQLYSVKMSVGGEYVNTIYLKMAGGSPDDSLTDSETKAVSDIVKHHFPDSDNYLIIKKPSRSEG